mmetsp:Transcript_59143/g.95593  ORF Transcript_59143/g.95593 Transcript_59143/m.95593 type:complete len:278 (-) Transcript_59143:632-1465(-)
MMPLMTVLPHIATANPYITHITTRVRSIQRSPLFRRRSPEHTAQMTVTPRTTAVTPHGTRIATGERIIRLSPLFRRHSAERTALMTVTPRITTVKSSLTRIATRKGIIRLGPLFRRRSAERTARMTSETLMAVTPEGTRIIVEGTRIIMEGTRIIVTTHRTPMGNRVRKIHLRPLFRRCSRKPLSPFCRRRSLCPRALRTGFFCPRTLRWRSRCPRNHFQGRNPGGVVQNVRFSVSPAVSFWRVDIDFESNNPSTPLSPCLCRLPSLSFSFSLSLHV